MKTETDRRIERALAAENAARRNMLAWQTQRKFPCTPAAQQTADGEIARYRVEFEELQRVRKQLERDHTNQTGELALTVHDDLQTCLEC